MLLSVFLHELKQLLDQAMPKAETATRIQLVLYQFITGLPAHVATTHYRRRKQPGHSAGEDATDFDNREAEKSAMIEAKEGLSEVEAPREQITALTEQVAALVTRCPATLPNRPQLCYRCHQPGHLQRQCTRSRGCFVCRRPGHIAKDCQLGNGRETFHRPGTPRAQVSLPSVSNVVVAAVRPSAAVLKGRLGDTEVDILLDSGSTVSLVQNSILARTLGVKQLKPGDLQLVSAVGEPMPVVGQANVVVQVGQLSVVHPLVVVDSLISPLIPGMDFLQQHDLVLVFASSPISVTTLHTPPSSHRQLQDIQPIVEDVQKAKAKTCAVYA